MKRLLGQTCLLDTNVLVYALDRASPHFPQASRVVTACQEGEITGIIAQQNLIELLHVLTAYYKVPVEQALIDVKAFATHPRFRVIGPSTATLTGFFDLLRQAVSQEAAPEDAVQKPQTSPVSPALRRVRRASVFDLYLAATMRDHQVDRIVTANTRDFAGVPEIGVVDLTSLAV